MINPWFKFYGSEYLSDLKIEKLDGSERSCWITLLAFASQTKDGVIKFLDEETLLKKSGVKEKINILQKLSDLDMISVNNGDVTVMNWEKRQYSESLNRVREFRKRERNDDVTTEKNRIEENRIEKIRNTYGEFEKVKLSDDEYQKLITYCGTEKNLKLLIVELDTYMASTKKKYDSHYATLQGWWRRKAQNHVENNKPKRTIA